MAGNNPIRGAFKRATERNYREVVKKENKELKRDARALEVHRRRNISSQQSEQILDKPNKADKRRQQLIAWKQQRDKQRSKATAKKGKQGEFVVKRVLYSPPKYLGAGAKRKPIQVRPEVSRRVTRSYAKRNEQKEPVQSKIPTPTKSQVNLKNENDHKAKEGLSLKNASAGSQSRSPTTGFLFTFDADGNVPRTFNFGNGSAIGSSAITFDDPISKFNESARKEQESSFNSPKPLIDFFSTMDSDPIVKFNESMKTEKESSFNASKVPIIPCAEFDPIARFNASLKIEANEDITLLSGAEPKTKEPAEPKMKEPADPQSKEYTEPTTNVCSDKNEIPMFRNLRSTPRRSAALNDRPGKTPKRPLAVPKYMVDEMETKIFSSSRLANLSNPGKHNTEAGAQERSPLPVTCEEKNALKGKPGTTPKRPLAVPMHMVQAMEAESFTPRRIKSTAHFRSLVEDERTKLNELNKIWTGYLEKEELMEDVSGHIRSVVGQAQLLMDQRFKQFEDLIKLHQSHKKVQGADASDLAGFWDMIIFQIEDVQKKFKELDSLRKNNWEHQKPKKITKAKKIVETKKKDSAKLTARQEATRKFKQAMRARMQSLKSESENDEVLIISGKADNQLCSGIATINIEDQEKKIALEELDKNQISPKKMTAKSVRRSIRNTPSKYQTAKENENTDEDNGFFKYLRPSFSVSEEMSSIDDLFG